MKRREFVTLIGSAAFAQVFRPVARAQETGRTYQLGIIYGGSRETPRIAAFFDELKLLGFAEGKNLNVARGGFNLRNDQYAEYARTLVKSNPDVIFSVGDAPTLAAKEANQTIPIVGFLSPNYGRHGCDKNVCPTRRQCHWRRHSAGRRQATGTTDGSSAWRVEDRNPGGPDVHPSRATPTT